MDKYLIKQAEQAREELSKPVNVMMNIHDENGLEKARTIIENEMDRRAAPYIINNEIVKMMVRDAKKAQLEALEKALRDGKYKV